MMPSDIMDSMCNTVTLSGTESDTITITADTVSLDDIAMGFSDTTYDVKIPEDLDWGNYFTPNEIQVGKHKITSDMVEKLQALLDIMENLDNDHDLKQLFNTQISMNKIRGDHGSA